MNLKNDFYKNTKLALLGTALVQTAVIGFSTLQALKAQALMAQYAADPMMTGAIATMPSPFMMIPIYSIIILFAALWALKEMKSPNYKSFLGTGFVFLLATSSWAIPFALLGLYSMLNDPHRDQYFQQFTQKVQG